MKSETMLFVCSVFTMEKKKKFKWNNYAAEVVK